MNQKIHVAFFIDNEHTIDKWSSIKNIFDECCNDKNFKVFIIKESNSISDTYNDYLKNLDKKVHIYTYYNNGNIFDLLKLNIDFIFTINPYYQKYMNWNIWKEKIKICFKSYCVYCDKTLEKKIDNDYKKLPIYEQSSYVFCESEFEKECLENYWGENNKFVVSGCAKFDYILKGKDKINQNLWKLNKNENPLVKRVIWSPHWSIKKHWSYGNNDTKNIKNGFCETSEEGYSQFTKYSDLWLKIPKIYPNLDIVMKPHPTLFKNLEYQTDGEWTQNKIDNWKKDFLNNSNTQIMENGLYDDLFLTSDAIINDSISFTVEYLPTLKPFLLCINPNSVGYNDWGNEIIKSYYKAYEEKDIINFIENILFKNNDYLYEERKKAMKENLFLPEGGSGNFIKNYIKKEFLFGDNTKLHIDSIKNIYKQLYAIK